MNQEILTWLLDGPSWLKYAVELQLLDKKPKADNALADNSIKEIVSGLKSQQGLPALNTGSLSYQGKIYWDLFFLADIGFTVKGLHLEKEAAKVYDLQTPDGKFVTMKDMKPDFLCIPTSFCPH